MSQQHELIGNRIELSRKYKKEMIVAESISTHLKNLLSQSDYENMDIEDLQLSVEIMTKAIEEMRSISIKLAKINAALGNY